MTYPISLRIASFTVVLAVTAWPQDPALSVLGTYRTGRYNAGAAEIVAHDPATQRLFVVNGGDRTIDILDMSNPANLRRISQVRFPAEHGIAANSVAVKNGIVAVAVEADPKTDPGSALFLDADGRILAAVKVGALPDMLTFTPDGRKVLVANEGEPNTDYTADPEGSMSIIDISRGATEVTQADVKTAHFRNFTREMLDPSVRIFGPGASVAQDLEPEYIAVSPDSKTAWVTLQEGNAIGIIDVDTATVTRIVGLGLKEHWREENSIDASDRDNAVSLRTWTVWGFYMPDAIAPYVAADGNVYLLTANEGDAREYAAYAEERRVSEVRLDPARYPNASEIQQASELGRLRITAANGDIDGDGDYDMLHSFGGRSFTVWTARVEKVWDSMNHFEIINSQNYPESFNASNSDNVFDSRSDDKGPEPEALTTGVIGGRTFAFIGNERQSNIIVYDVTDPRVPRYIEQYTNRNPRAAIDSPEAGDLGPEGIIFIPAAQSPTGRPLLAVANEISGTTTLWQIN